MDLHEILNVGVYNYHPKPDKLLGGKWVRLIRLVRLIDNSVFFETL